MKKMLCRWFARNRTERKAMLMLCAFGDSLTFADRRNTKTVAMADQVWIITWRNDDVVLTHLKSRYGVPAPPCIIRYPDQFNPARPPGWVGHAITSVGPS